MMAFPVSGSRPTVYRPSQRPSFRLRMFPSPFARLFGIKSTPFANEQYRNQEGKATRKRNSYQKVIICLAVTSALSLSMATQFLRCRGGTLFWFQRCDFRTDENPFLLSTAAQNIHVFLRESSLHKKHFFEWLETAISSNACGMSTLKSLLPQAFAVSNVHPRPRKRPPRCTLDCGFQTPESPALRGFVGGLRALATAALYLVLKSNGLHLSKNLPAKFGFSPKPIPTNIAKKLPPQRCSKPFLIPIFNFSHKRPTFAFTPEIG